MLFSNSTTLYRYIVARPVVLPEKDADTAAAEAKEEERARRVERIKVDMEEAKDKVGLHSLPGCQISYMDHAVVN
jgi:hypothetical protein